VIPAVSLTMPRRKDLSVDQFTTPEGCMGKPGHIHRA
jgi:hypothetical protein